MDINFKDVISGLNELNVNYWVCNGTLLGLVRDGDLIPWDHDIDIAFWANDVLILEITKKMYSLGFCLNNDGGGYDFLEFSRLGGRNVDFNFFKLSSQNFAYSEWYLPRNWFCSLVLSVVNAKKYRGRHKKFIAFMYYFQDIFFLIEVALKKISFLYRSAGYTIPSLYLEDFEIVNFQGLPVRLPVRSIEILHFIYGEKWKVPFKAYNWVKDSDATVISNKRFKL
jgi:hypothetical protein